MKAVSVRCWFLQRMPYLNNQKSQKWINHLIPIQVFGKMSTDVKEARVSARLLQVQIQIKSIVTIRLYHLITACCSV